MADAGLPPLPYCGTPPSVATLWTRWNLDPVLLVALLALLLAWFGARRLQRTPMGSLGSFAFLTGWVIGSMALISPLCALSVSLFSARIGQHMVLTTVVAPLIALGLPKIGKGAFGRPLPAALGFIVTLWFWHAPGAYAATFASHTIYWVMHLTTFGSALWFWLTVLRGPSTRLAPAIAATIIGGVQMAFLGALITFSPRALYAAHVLTTQAWGLTPLQDQQIGGAIMWIPASVIFVAAILGPLGLVLRQDRGHALSGASTTPVVGPAV